MFALSAPLLLCRRVAAEVEGDVLGEEFKGYVFKIMGGQDKQVREGSFLGGGWAGESIWGVFWVWDLFWCIWAPEGWGFGDTGASSGWWLMRLVALNIAWICSNATPQQRAAAAACSSGGESRATDSCSHSTCAAGPVFAAMTLRFE